jgi:hypothetical protein
MLGVLTKRALHCETERFLLNRDVDAEVAERLVQVGVEAGDRQPAGEEERFRPAVSRLHDESILEKVEDDLEFRFVVVEATGGEAADVDVERHVPPVVPRSRRRQPHLPEDLAVEVERVLRRTPVCEVKLGERHEGLRTKAISST